MSERASAQGLVPTLNMATCFSCSSSGDSVVILNSAMVSSVAPLASLNASASLRRAKSETGAKNYCSEMSSRFWIIRWNPLNSLKWYGGLPLS